jgi:hypothetical protein
VAVKEADGIDECPEVGGAVVEVATKPGIEVCNGANGAEGEKGDEGDPWTAGGTLPPGATETGAWSFSGSDATPTMFAPISFFIPLGPGMFSGPNAEIQSHYSTQPDFSTFCHGTALAPTAPPGELCVYQGEVEKSEFVGVGNTQTQFSLTPGQSGSGGGIIRFSFTGAAGEAAFGFGSFAITGCDPATDGQPDSCPE